ncbi:MAG: restriction endonuclease subunit S, partial [Paracoccus sp.]|nr:restriction endonuclease subunit S [Paracoccus sp. (in: a-proteobacteria)]
PRGPARGELDENEEVDFLPMADLHESGSIRIASTRRYEEVAKGYTAFRSGDVLVAKITPCFENNKIALANITTTWGFGSTEFHVLRSGSELDPTYLAHFLRQDSIREAGEKRMTGSAGQRRVPKAFFEELQIPLPPLAEQKRIAGILDQADALRRLRARALEKLNALGQAIFQEMFGTFHDDYGSWQLSRLDVLIADAQIGAVRGAKEMDDDKPVKYLRMDAIGTDGSLSLEKLRKVDASQSDLEKYGLQVGDLVFNTRNSQELVGKAAVVRTPFSGIYNNNILRMRFCENMTADFLDAFLRTRKGQADLAAIKSGTTSVFAIYQKSLMMLDVPVPPPNHQRKYSDRMQELSQARKRYTNAIEAAESLFASLQHRAFRGEL